MIRRLCIIGVGLIGGSLALALRRSGYCGEIVGCSRDEDHLRRAVELGVIDRYVRNPAQAVQGADMVVLAVPVQAMLTILQTIRDHLDSKAVITDVGSTKAAVVQAVKQVFGALPANFVPAHPIAGTERSGVEAAFAALFDHRQVILTPEAATSPVAIEQVAAMWRAAGAEISQLTVQEHDALLAVTSHLPHLLAFALVDAVTQGGEQIDILRYAAGGFRDTTRIAASDPIMWRDICLTNQAPLLAALDRFSAGLNQVRQSVAQGDGPALEEMFRRAKRAREKFHD